MCGKQKNNKNNISIDFYDIVAEWIYADVGVCKPVHQTTDGQTTNITHNTVTHGLVLKYMYSVVSVPQKNPGLNRAIYYYQPTGDRMLST